MRERYSAFSAILALALVLAMMPSGAVARDETTDGPVKPAGTTYDIDEYDAAGMGDSVPLYARNVTALMGDYGVEHVENHTFHVVNGTSGDIDWVKFTVTADDVNIDKTSYLLRTQSANWNLDTVIEVYGPYATSSFSYTAGYLAGSADPLCIASNDEDIWRSVAHDSALVFRPPSAGPTTCAFGRGRPGATTTATRTRTS